MARRQTLNLSINEAPTPGSTRLPPPKGRSIGWCKSYASSPAKEERESTKPWTSTTRGSQRHFVLWPAQLRLLRQTDEFDAIVDPEIVHVGATSVEGRISRSPKQQRMINILIGVADGFVIYSSAGVETATVFAFGYVVALLLPR